MSIARLFKDSPIIPDLDPVIDVSLLNRYRRNCRNNLLDLFDEDLDETNINTLIHFLIQNPAVTNIDLRGCYIISDTASQVLASHQIFKNRNLMGFTLPPLPSFSISELHQIEGMVSAQVKQEPHLDKIVTEYLDEHSVSYGYEYAKQSAREQIQSLYERGMYVFVHGMGITYGFYHDLLSTLNRPSSENQLTWGKRQYVFRASCSSENFPCSSDELFAQYNSKIDDSTEPFRSGLLSTSLSLDNQEIAESADYFFSDSLSTRNNIDIQDFEKKIGEELVNQCMQKDNTSYQSTLNKILEARQKTTIDIKHAGRLCLIAIPKNIVEDKKYNFTYRSHALGVPCTQFFNSPVGVSVDKKGRATECNCSTSKGNLTEYPIQARLLMSGLKLLNQFIEIYTYDSLNASQRRDWEISLRLICNMLRERISSNEFATSYTSIQNSHRLFKYQAAEEMVDSGNKLNSGRRIQLWSLNTSDEMLIPPNPTCNNSVNR